jgi:hypothetical protein
MRPRYLCKIVVQEVIMNQGQLLGRASREEARLVHGIKAEMHILPQRVIGVVHYRIGEQR